jgi:hypothetical protein
MRALSSIWRLYQPNKITATGFLTYVPEVQGPCKAAATDWISIPAHHPKEESGPFYKSNKNGG